MSPIRIEQNFKTIQKANQNKTRQQFIAVSLEIEREIKNFQATMMKWKDLNIKLLYAVKLVATLIIIDNMTIEVDYSVV